MNYYYLIFAVLCINSILWHVMRKNEKRTLYIISCVILLVFTIYRSPLDTNWPDTYNYVNTFSYISENVEWKDLAEIGWEPGVVVIAKMVGNFVNSEQAYIVTFGLIILIPIFITIWKNSELPMLGLVTFYAMGSLMATSIFREWCAIAILLSSVPYIKERKIFKFAFFVLVAVAFHRTAIVFAVAYFIYDIPISKKHILEAVGMSVVLYLSGRPLLNILNRFARFKQDAEYNGGISMLLVLWICVVASYTLCKQVHNDQGFAFCFNMMLIAAMIQPVAFTFSIWSRVVLYFSNFLIFLLPRAITCVEQGNTNNRRLAIPIELAYMFLMLIWFASRGYGQYVAFR